MRPSPVSGVEMFANIPKAFPAVLVPSCLSRWSARGLLLDGLRRSFGVCRRWHALRAAPACAPFPLQRGRRDLQEP